MNKYLYKISLCADSVWSPYHRKKVKPIYIVGDNKEWVKEFAISNMRDGVAIKSISVVGRQLSPIVFTGEIQEKNSHH